MRLINHDPIIVNFVNNTQSGLTLLLPLSQPEPGSTGHNTTQPLYRFLSSLRCRTFHGPAVHSA